MTTTQDFLLTVNNPDPLVVALPESHKRTIGLDPDWIEARQDEGNDIYFCPNTIKGLDRTADQVTAVNSCWIDVDGTMPVEVAPEDTTVTGRDDTHWHAYWTLKEGEDIQYWRQVQSALAKHFGSDPAVVDPPRLMRLPGTLNLKEDIAHEHAIIYLSDRTWTLNEIIEEYGLVLEDIRLLEGERVSLDVDMPDDVRTTLIKDLNELQAHEGERYATGRRWMMKAIGAGMEIGEARALLSDWFEAMGYGSEQAIRQAQNTQKGLVEKLESGKLPVQEELRPDLVFPDDEGTERGGCDNSDIIEPSVYDKLKDRLAASAQIEMDVLENTDLLVRLSELEFEKLTVELKAIGRVGNGAGRIGETKLSKIYKLAKKEGENASKIDETIVKQYKQSWKQVWCVAKGSQFGYYIHDGTILKPISKDAQLESWIRYITSEMTGPDSARFKDLFYEDIHDNRCIGSFEAVTVPFGKTKIEFEKGHEGSWTARTFVSMKHRLEVLEKRFDGVDVPQEFVDFLDKEYLVVWIALKAALARRFLGDKQSIIWIKCQSDWGKSFFFALDELAIFLDNGYDEDSFKGNDPSHFASMVYCWIDEATKFTKEMKLDALPYRKLYGGEAKVRLPMRIMASANSISDLMDGADRQIVNRVCKLDAEPVELAVRLRENGWDNNIARKWYEKLVVQRMMGWLEEWDGDEVPGSGYFRSFVKKFRLNGGEDILEVIRRHFLHHFLFDHVKGNEFTGFGKKRAGWAWGDENSEFLYLEDGVLYFKRVKKWFALFISKEFSDDKQFMARKSAGSTEDIVKTLGARVCSHLPRKGGPLRKWEGFAVDLVNCEGLEELGDFERA